MQFQGALVMEQGVKFAVVTVKRNVLDNRTRANETISTLSPVFGSVPVVLMGQDSHGTPSYYGRGDIVRFLSRIPIQSIPWRQYSLN